MVHMRYLMSQNYYNKKFDKRLVKKCIEVYQKLEEMYPKIKDDKLVIRKATREQILYAMLFLAWERNQTIQRWIDEDTSKEEFAKNVSMPNIDCFKCGAHMEKEKEAISVGIWNSPHRMLFAMRCPKCANMTNIYDDWELHKEQERRCVKCWEPFWIPKGKQEDNQLFLTWNCKHCWNKEEKTIIFPGKENIKTKSKAENLELMSFLKIFKLSQRDALKYDKLRTSWNSDKWHSFVDEFERFITESVSKRKHSAKNNL